MSNTVTGKQRIGSNKIRRSTCIEPKQTIRSSRTNGVVYRSCASWDGFSIQRQSLGKDLKVFRVGKNLFISIEIVRRHVDRWIGVEFKIEK